MNYSNQLVNRLKFFFIINLILITNIFSFEKDFYLLPINELNDTIIKTNQIDTLKFQMSKSPWNAVLKSALVPGWGQYYNESYWKIPIILGAFTYLGYQWKVNNDNYINYKNLFQKSISSNQTNSNYYKLREFYRDQRDLFTIYIGIVYLLNLIDAYVDSHLFDFNVNENIHSKYYMIEIKLKL